MTRVLVAVGHPGLSHTLCALLRDEVGILCRRVGLALELSWHLSQEQWDVLLLDLRFPGRSKRDTVKIVHHCHPKVSILVTSLLRYVPRRHWSDVGASGFIPKAELGDRLVEAVRVLADGGQYFIDLA